MLAKLQQLFSKQSTDVKAGRLCLAFDDKGVAIVHLEAPAEPEQSPLPVLQQAYYQPLPQATTDLTVQQAPLQACLEKLALTNMATTLLLTPTQYRLLLIDAPKVPESEWAEAARWQINDLLDFPASEAVIDVFSLPTLVADKQLMYVAAARQAWLEAQTSMLSAVGCRVDCIDIMELGMRNLLQHYYRDSAGVALIYLSEQQSIITVCQGDSLYLTRHLECDWATIQALGEGQLEAIAPTAEQALMDLTLEIQRSLDYYQSQFRQPGIQTVLLYSNVSTPDVLASQLAKQLRLKVSCFDFARSFSYGNEVEYDSLTACIPVIGGALREFATS